jgi:hypothetical protein
VRGEEGHEGQLVHETRHLARQHLDRAELRVLELDVAHRLSTGATAVEDDDAGAHSLEDVKESRATRVEAHVVHRQVAAGDERRRGKERRRRREVARHGHLPQPKRGRLLHRDRRRPAPHADPCALEHELGVIAGGRRLDDRRLPGCIEAREKNRRLDLGARDRQLVGRAPQRLDGLDRERRVPVGRRDARAQEPKRLGDPLHRPLRQRLVARERRRGGLSRGDAGEQAHQRARVPAVDRSALEAAQAGARDDELVVRLLDDLDAQRPHGGDRRLGVAGAPEAGDARRALADRAEENGTMRDRLVAGDGDVPGERNRGLYAHERCTTSRSRGP